MTHHREEVAKRTKTVFFFFSDGDRSSKKLWRLQDDNFKVQHLIVVMCAMFSVCPMSWNNISAESLVPVSQ